MITPVDDSEVEGPETVNITLNSGSGYNVGSPNAAVVTILDNDGTQTQPIILTSILDSYLQMSRPNNNYGSSTELRIRDGVEHVSGGAWREVLVQFDLSSISSSTVIIGAELRLLCSYIYKNNIDSNVKVYRVTSAWTETGVTYNNRPDHAGLVEATESVTSTGWKSWDVTDLVTRWNNGVQVNYGFKIRGESGAWITFDSGEGSNAPELIITRSINAKRSILMQDDLHNDSEIPEEYELYQNYPNPFNQETSIKFQLKDDAKVELVICDIRGSLVIKLLSANMKAGYHSVIWNGLNGANEKVTSGMYFCQTTIKSSAKLFYKTRKMILLK